MTFYHGTSKHNWQLIQKQGILFGKGMSYRYTYLTPDITVASNYGDVILQIQYDPVGVGSGVDNYIFDVPIGCICWQFSVFIPIKLQNIKEIK